MIDASSVRSRRIGLSVCAAILLAGCATTGETISARDGSFEDHDKRHPIALRQERYTLDILAGNGLDDRTRAQIAEFADLHVRLGTGPIAAMLPTGTGEDRAYQKQFEETRRALLARGLRTPIRTGTYPVANPGLGSPIQLSFAGIKARVTTRCGEWPDDLASGSSLSGFQNRPYWNHGCATQMMHAAQAADPRDLFNPRALSSQDSEMRSRAITNVRKGVDPGTAWRVETTTIGAVGSQ